MLGDRRFSIVPSQLSLLVYSSTTRWQCFSYFGGFAYIHTRYMHTYRTNIISIRNEKHVIHSACLPPSLPPCLPACEPSLPRSSHSPFDDGWLLPLLPLRWTFKKNISLVLTVPTAISSRSGLHARQETGLGRLLWQRAIGRLEAVFQIATDLSGSEQPQGRAGGRKVI